MDDPTDRDAERRREPRKPKPPRKVSPRYLENAALHYLKRYAATVSQLKRVLARRVDRSVKFHGGDRSEAMGWVDALAEKLIRNGLINDRTYAETRVHSLRASGRSARVITQKLRMKGVAPELVQEKLAEATQDVSEDAAALIWARKKRLGPFRRDPSTRADHRQKDLAALARAGFSFAIAKRIVDGTADDAPPRR